MLVQKYTYIDSNAIDYINQSIEGRNDFNEKKFNSWLQDNNIANKNNPSAYIKYCFLKELENGTFDKGEVDISSLLNAMRKQGIEITKDSDAMIYATNQYIYENDILTINELCELNHKIVDYLAEHNLNSDYYRIVVAKSHALKDKNIDWDEISDRANSLIQEWNELMEELEN